MKIKRIDVNNPIDIRENLTDSLKNTGFAVFTGNPDFTYVYDTWKDFFQAPLDVKAKFAFDRSQQHQNGYFPYKSENAKGEVNPDLKEFYQIYHNTGYPDQQIAHQMFGLHARLTNLARIALAEIGEDLYLGNILNEVTRNSPTLLRVIYYPEIPNNEKGVRAAAHEDINLITLLPASTNPGLQVKDTEGNWYDVGTEKGDIIVNVGDMLQMLSKGKYKSTTHRVINLPGDRLSMPMFVHPVSNYSLGEMTAGEYLDQRLREIGLK